MAAGVPTGVVAPVPPVGPRARGAGVVSSNERAFVQEAVRAERRVDGRGPFDFRRVRVSFSREDGTAEVVLGGQTRVLGVVSAELKAPFRDRASEGSLAVFLSVSPAAHEAASAASGSAPGAGGSSSEEAVELSRIVDRSLRESKAVDMEALCVVAGRLAWALRLELHVLDHGGNLVDAACLAALAALMSFRVPQVTVEEHPKEQASVTIHPPEERDPQPLTLHLLPITLTFAFFNDGNDAVLDPSAVEESAMGGRFSVAVSSQAGDVCALQKPGGIPISAAQLLRCVRIAAATAPDLEKILRESVDALNAERAERKIKRWRRPLAGTGAAEGGSVGAAGLGERRNGSEEEGAEPHLKMEVEEEEDGEVSAGEDEGEEESEVVVKEEQEQEAANVATDGVTRSALPRVRGKASAEGAGTGTVNLRDSEGLGKTHKMANARQQGGRSPAGSDGISVPSSSSSVSKKGRGLKPEQKQEPVDEDDPMLTLEAAVKRNRSPKKTRQKNKVNA